MSYSPAAPTITNMVDASQAIMHPENICKWLDAVDQDHLEPLDQWGVPSPRHPPQDAPIQSDSERGGSARESYEQYNEKYNAEVASLLASIPPTGILLRNGSIRRTGQDPIAYDVENANHPKSLIHGFAMRSEASRRRTDASSTRPLQTSGSEGNSYSIKHKALPTPAERARMRAPSVTSRPTPAIHVEVKDLVAINCKGARVVGGYQRNGPQTLPSMKNKSRKNTTTGERALHRSNAVRRPSNVRLEPTSHQKTGQLR